MHCLHVISYRQSKYIPSFLMAHPGRLLKCDPKVANLRSDIRQGNYDVVKSTLKEFGINAKDGDGRTALINAVIEKKVDFIYWLVENGADLNHQDNIGYSVLHFAGQDILVELAKYFLEKGSNPNLPDIHGNTALWTAIFSTKLPTDNQGVVKLLLKYGADPDILNKYGKTPKFIYQTFHSIDISTIDLT
jgi:ankyrin repeat protein